MTGKQWIRQSHRWTSIVFMVVSGAIFLSLGLGHPPAQWVYYLPLLPLALLALSGMYMFFLPYVKRSRRDPSIRSTSVARS